MSWKHIKTVMIFLFLIINIYLLHTSSWNIGNSDTTEFDRNTYSMTADIIKNNFSISIDTKIIPEKIKNLKNIYVTNIIYTKEFKDARYNQNVNNGFFEADIQTTTYSYNEENAVNDLKRILSELGIKDTNYEFRFSKSDTGLVCTVSEKISVYPVFNGKITAVFSPALIQVKGKWYVAENEITDFDNSSVKMVSINSVLMDTAEKMSIENTGKKISGINYGYFVSYYDENTVSKSASAIPCYMIETDTGYKYYYDATNGKNLKQEE